MSKWRDAALTFTCGQCGAPPTEPCRTYRPTVRPPGMRATYQHRSRDEQVREILHLSGWDEYANDELNRRVAQQRAVETLRDEVRPYAARDAGVSSRWLLGRLNEILEK